MNRRKNISILFFFLTFLIARIADAHAFTHFSDDDQVHCELCELIVVSSKITPVLDNVIVEIKPKSSTIITKININFDYKTSQYCITLPKYIYNKPPPAIQHYCNIT